MLRRLLALVVLLASSQAARGADWPQWRGPLSNGLAPDSPPLAAAWPADGPVKLWENHDLALAPAPYAGGQSCPVVAQGKVFVYVHDVGVPRDTIACLDFASGELLWRQDFEGQTTWHGGSGTPCVVGDRVYVSGARFAYCLQTETGELVWKVDLATPPAPGQEDSSSFVVAGGVAMVLSGEVLGLDVDSGEVLWRAPTAGGYASAMASVAPWSHEGEVYGIYGGGGRLACLKPATGEVVWERTTDRGRMEPAPSPAIEGDDMAMWFVDRLSGWHLAPEGPEELWSARLPDDYGSPAVWDGRVYTVGRHGKDDRFSVCGRELQTGNVLWDTAVNGPEFTSPLVADGKVLVLTDRNALLRMLDATTGQPLGSMFVGAQLWSSPALAEGKVLVRTPDGVACWDLSAAANPAPGAALPATDHYLQLTEATRNVCGYSVARQDSSIASTPLRIGDTVFARGIGSHASCELIFPLAPEARWVTLYAGASGDGARGSVTVSVWLDDRLAWESPVMRGQEPPRYVSLPTDGARELRLVGGDGGDGNDWDHVNLANLRVCASDEEPAPDGP